MMVLLFTLPAGPAGAGRVTAGDDFLAGGFWC
jgi:hypothetical protein